MPRFCAIVPCLNHHVVIADITRTLLEHVEKVFIIDDGSNDDTRQALLTIAQNYRAQVSVYRFEENRGKGAAVMQGARLAAEDGFSHAIQVDADGQHDLVTIPLLIEHARTYPEDVVNGVPVYDDSVNRLRFVSRYITHFWVWIETLSFEIKDSMCGFRVYPLEAFLNIIDKYNIGRRMDFDTDSIVRLYWSGCHVINVPVRVKYIKGGLSNFRLVKDNLLISYMHVRLVAGMLWRFPQLLRRNIRASTTYEAHWSRQVEKGSYLGIKILFWVYRHLGRWVFTGLLHPVITFFFVFSPEKRRVSRQYLNQVRSFSKDDRPVRWYDCYRHFLAFGQCTLDKLAAWANTDLKLGLFEGEEYYKELEARNAGAVFIGSHLGNLEYCRAMSRAKTRKTINAVVFTEHAENFMKALKEVAPDVDINLVQVSSFGIDTAIRFREKINQGEILVIVGDRTSPFGNDRNVQVEFLGKPALFPQGPFVLASLMDCPAYLLFCVKSNRRYNIYLEPFRERMKLPRAERADALRAVIQDYAVRLEYYCRQYPLQWFNFFEFWVRSDNKNNENMT